MLMNACRANQQSACTDWWNEGHSSWHKEVLLNAEAVLTKECSWVKDLEQELKDLKSHSQVELNASVLLPMTVVTAGPTMQVVIPASSLPQPEAGPSCLPCLSQRPGPLICPYLSMRWGPPPHLRRLTSGAASPWKWMMYPSGWQKGDSNQLMTRFLSLRDNNEKGCAPQPIDWASIAFKLSRKITWHNHQVIHWQTPPFVKRGRGCWTELRWIALQWKTESWDYPQA